MMWFDFKYNCKNQSNEINDKTSQLSDCKAVMNESLINGCVEHTCGTYIQKKWDIKVFLLLKMMDLIITLMTQTIVKDERVVI